MTATAADVYAGRAAWSVEPADALEWLRAQPDGAADLVFFSCPYEAQRTYGIGAALRGQAWVDWLRPVVREAARVSAGLVVVNAAGPVREFKYSPSVEWLVADLTRLDGLVTAPAPWCWWKVCGIPGSGRLHYQRRDWEPLYGFCLPDRLPLRWADNTAFGTRPKFNPGGEFAGRDRNGTRANAKGGGRVVAGAKLATRPPPDVANPGNVIRAESSDLIEARVGGGHLGHDLAHESEAPMPLAVAERFVCWYCPPGGLVVDPFAGSGTTAHAALIRGRRFAGCDVRESQCSLTRRRLATVTPALF